MSCNQLQPVWNVAAVAYWFILCVGYVALSSQRPRDQTYMYIPMLQVRENSAIVYQYWTGARKAHLLEITALNLTVPKILRNGHELRRKTSGRQLTYYSSFAQRMI